MKRLFFTLLCAATLVCGPVFAADPAAPTPAPAAEQQETGFWLTEKGGKRHNAKCRFYKKTKGKPCGEKDGQACKVCGG